MAAKKEYPRQGRPLGSLGTTTITGVCEWELPEGSRMRPAPHGTTARYAQAQRVGAPRCQECRTANTQADLEYRRARKDRPALRLVAADEKLTRADLVRIYEGNGLGEVPKSWTAARIRKAMGEALK